MDFHYLTFILKQRFIRRVFNSSSTDSGFNKFYFLNLVVNQNSQ
jgi:hypothetical protein